MPWPRLALALCKFLASDAWTRSAAPHLGLSGGKEHLEDLAEVTLKGTISRQQEHVSVEFDLQEWSYLKSIILFARKAANGPLFANDVESASIERLARTLLDELGFERHD